MGYFFTLLYLLAAYLTPPVLFGPLSDYHIEVIVVLLALVFTVPNLPGSGLGRAPQTLALAGIFLSIVVSIAQSGWLGGVVGPVYGFMQPLFAFGLVAANCKRRRHLQWIVLAFLLVSCFFMVRGIQDLQGDVYPSPYLFGDDFKLRRLRGLGFVNDPNDFSQVLVSLIPAVFLWRTKSVFANVFVLGVPVAVLVTGIYLTHSRGAMLALILVVLLTMRRKIGAVPAAVLSAALLAGLFAAGFTGGRDVSMDAGADRLDLWYDGLETIKAHPLFGIGLDGFIDRFGITAHNSVIICASELGIVGLFFWVLFVFSTMRRAIHLGAKPVGDAPVEAEALPARDEPPAAGALGVERLEDTVGMARLLFLSLSGLLTAGWFLSRALSMWLFMYCGMVYAVSRMKSAEKTLPEDKLSYLARWSVGVTVGLLLALYLILRARNIVGR
jgi:hypothetical protein